MRYDYRRNILEGETTLDLTESGLQVVRAGGTPAFVPYDKIVFVRLRYAPTRFATNLYICTIMSLASLPVEVHSSSYAGIANFSDKPTEYRAFVGELHRRLAAVGSRAEFVAGSSSVGYVLNVLVIVLAAMMLVWVVSMVGGLPLTWTIAIKLLVIAGMVPLVWRWFRRNRPKSYDPRALPEDVLPAAVA